MTAPFDLDRLDELLLKATAGKWEWCEDTTCGILMRTLSPGILVLDNDPGCGGPWGDDIDRANATLIVEAVNALPALIAELRGSREALKYTHAALTRAYDIIHKESGNVDENFD
jgi:hypothetical protein